MDQATVMLIMHGFQKNIYKQVSFNKNSYFLSIYDCKSIKIKNLNMILDKSPKNSPNQRRTTRQTSATGSGSGSETESK